MLIPPDREWAAQPPASEVEIEQLASQSNVPLPADYLDLLRHCNGGEGPLALAPLWFQLYSINDCIELFYQNRQLLTELPDFRLFGSNGGLELIGFDLRSGPPWPVVMIDPIAGPESAQQIAPDMRSFIEAIGLESAEGGKHSLYPARP